MSLFAQSLILLLIAVAVTAKPIEVSESAAVPIDVATELERLARVELSKLQSELPSSIIAPTNRSFVASPRLQFGRPIRQQIRAGAPPAFFTVSIETGLPSMFLFNKAPAPELEIPNPYNSDLSVGSTPLGKPYKVRSGGGVKANGELFEDVVGIPYPLDANFDQQFGVLKQIDYSLPFGADGVLGISWDPNQKTRNNSAAPPVFNFLKTQTGHLDPFNVVVLEEEGVVLWRTYKQLPFRIPVHSVGGAAGFQLSSFAVADYESHIAEEAIIDSGYSVIALPVAHHRALLKAAHPSFNAELGVWTVGCAPGTQRSPTLRFGIRKEEFVVRQRHYVLDRDYPNDLCVFAAAPSYDGVFHLGLPFLRSVYLTLDPANNAIELGHVPVPNKY